MLKTFRNKQVKFRDVSLCWSGHLLWASLIGFDYYQSETELRFGPESYYQELPLARPRRLGPKESYLGPEVYFSILL